MTTHGFRFIPTPAGNRSAIASATVMDAVHPHVRGERFPDSPYRNALIGSSPRLWGTGDKLIHCLLPPRFIPMPVGNRYHTLSSTISHPVHPHACGEQVFVVQNVDSPPGSSPRPWGTARHRSTSASYRRFIPTPVGNGFHPCVSLQPLAVHPHGRGDEPAYTNFESIISNCSPRAWG